MFAPTLAPVRCPDCDTPGAVEVIPGHAATRWEPALPAQVGEVRMGCDCYNTDPDAHMRRVARNLFGG